MKADKKHDKKVATVKLHTYHMYKIHLHISIYIYHRLLISNFLNKSQ